MSLYSRNIHRSYRLRVVLEFLLFPDSFPVFGKGVGFFFAFILKVDRLYFRLHTGYMWILYTATENVTNSLAHTGFKTVQKLYMVS